LNILRQSREHLAFRPAPRPAPSLPEVDAVQKWKKEADQKAESDRVELERDQRARERRRQQQQETATQGWADYVARAIDAAMVNERKRTEAVLIELLADVLRQHDELVKRVAALEAEVKR
jgi:hypothetical protein